MIFITSLGKVFGEILNLKREALLQQVEYSGQTLDHWIEIIKIPLFIIRWKCLENKKNGRWYQSQATIASKKPSLPLKIGLLAEAKFVFFLFV